MWRTIAICTVLVQAGLALAQNNAINWRRDPQQAVAEAQRTGLPIMAYVRASERYRDDQLDREHKRSFRDPRIMKKAEMFVPLLMSRAQHRQILTQFGFSERANMVMSFVTPTGEQLGQISAQGIAQVESLSQKLTKVYQAYGQHLYKNEVKPRLDKKKLKPGEVKQALELVARFRIQAAEKDVIELLERDRVPASVQRYVYETLAILSSKDAVEKLIELAREDDKLARQALDKCNPVAAEMMLEGLKAEPGEFDFLLYEVVTTICRVPDTKPERWFENSNEHMLREEIDRVSNIVRTVAKRWKALNE